ncbi:MAG: Hpt domain-containing protein, partial [Gallionellaceae bacterium]
MDAIQQAFVVEGRELLQWMEDSLLQMEENGGDPETINAIFRAAHTIKGGAGTIECRFIVDFTHVLENVLDEMRAGTIVYSPDLSEILLHCADHLNVLIGCVENDAEPDEDTNKSGQSLQQALQHYLNDLPTTDMLVSEEKIHRSGGDSKMGSNNWHISLRFGSKVLCKGMDPASFLRYLQELGEIVHLTTLPDAMPDADQMDPESCYLGFEIVYKSDADKAKIESVFDFVRDDCVVHIWPPHSMLADFIRCIEELPEDTMQLGEILLKSGALTQAELDKALETQSAQLAETAETEESQPATASPKIGDVLVGQGAVSVELVEAAAVKQGKVADKKSLESQLIRVPDAKLDQLIDLVGEIVIASAGANMLAQRSGETALVESTSIITMLVEQIRDSALQLRMEQIGETFNRFQRVVRDNSREMDKQIELLISGSEAELDKSMVEKLSDPLMHLVRNALDHGIEAPQVRIKKGKSAQGTLKLNAFHE